MNCGLGYNSTPLSSNDLADIYNNYTYIHPSGGIGNTAITNTLDIITKHFITNAKIVEIGCSEGYLMKRMQSIGYTNLIGFDPSPQADIAISEGLNVRKQFFTKESLEGDRADGFIMVHTFEHFEDPFSILRTLIDNLDPEGKIIIVVPNMEGYHHEHRFFYNEHFLKRVFADCGLKIIDIVYETVSFKSRYHLACVAVRKDNNKYTEYPVTMTLEDAYNEAIEISKRYTDIHESFVRFLIDSESDVIYWWGAGSASVIMLNNIYRPVLGGREIVVVDGSSDNLGKFIPGTGELVHSFKCMKRADVIIASSYYNEILQTIKMNGIETNRILNIF
jgi:SAM-dependent methyltransferase